jgi:hypothetical protein
LTPDQIAELLRYWYRADRAAGVILPNGWFGRPYDNQHRLGWVMPMGRGLVVQLDEGLVIVISHPQHAVVEAGRFVIAGSSRVVFDREEYGSGLPHLDELGPGNVEFVAV